MNTYFDTLNQSLKSQNLVDLWPLGSNIQYGETVRHIVQDGSKFGKVISVSRLDSGRYESPVSYQC